MRLLVKAHVKAHQRVTAQGNVVQVRDYDDKRKPKQLDLFSPDTVRAVQEIEKPKAKRSEQDVIRDLDALSTKAEKRKNDATDESIRRLRPAASDWFTPEEFDEYNRLQAELPRSWQVQQEAKARVEKKRAERVAAMQGADSTKEPWQMTRREFQKDLKYLGPDSVANGQRKVGLVSSAQKREMQEAKRLGLAIVPVNKKQWVYARKKEDAQALADKMNAGMKDPELSRELGYTDQDRADLETHSYAAHLNLLKTAIQEGKPVPAEVFEDYPELKRTARLAEIAKQHGYSSKPEQADGSALSARSHSPKPVNQTDTPEFKKWFGDSKVVDADGKPLVVYHWTNAEFNTFDLDKTGTNNDPGMWGKGFYFSPYPTFGKGYGNKVKKTYLSIQNPLIVKKASSLPKELKPVLTQDGAIRLRNTLLSMGYDGVIQYETGEKPRLTQIVAFYPTQIKSATGNSGAFDPGNPDITKGYQLEGKTHYQGIPISIENRAGSVRSGTDPDGNPWETRMKYAYGKIPYAIGSDGESLDVFIGNHPMCDRVFIIPIRKKGTKQYDEDKVFLGFETRQAVWDAFREHYADARQFYSPMIEVPFYDFDHYVAMLKSGNEAGCKQYRKNVGLPIKKGFDMERVYLTLKTRSIQKGTVHSHQRVSKTGKVSIIPDFERVDKPSSVKIHHDIHKKKTGEFPFDVEFHGLHEEKGKLLRFKSLEKALTKIISYKDGDMLATVYHGEKKITLPVRKWTTIHREDFGLFGSKPNFQQVQETYKNMLDDQQRYVRITEPQAKQMSLFGKAMVWLTIKARRVLK